MPIKCGVSGNDRQSWSVGSDFFFFFKFPVLKRLLTASSHAVLGPAAAEQQSPGSLLETHHPEPHPRPSESESAF